MIPPCPRGRDMEAKVSSWEMLGNGGRRGREAERRGKRMEDDEKGDQSAGGEKEDIRREKERRSS